MRHGPEEVVALSDGLGLYIEVISFSFVKPFTRVPDIVLISACRPFTTMRPVL